MVHYFKKLLDIVEISIMFLFAWFAVSFTGLIAGLFGKGDEWGELLTKTFIRMGVNLGKEFPYLYTSIHYNSIVNNK